MIKELSRLPCICEGLGSTRQGEKNGTDNDKYPESPKGLQAGR